MKKNDEIMIAKNIASNIKKKVDIDKKKPTGNQNCLLCTWCSEALFRNINILPRAVYSPRDVIFKYTNANIVKYARKIYFNSKEELIKKILKGKRFYCHINWKNSNGGHVFLLLNINKEVYVLDSQNGLFENINKNNYFDNINFTNSFIVRTDNKQINKDLLKLNDNKYIIEFNKELDMKYL